MALKIIEKRKPDLILLDIMMPDMDGYEVCRKIKTQLDTNDIPIIFLTAKSETQDEAKGLTLGAVDYIVKPVRPEILQTRVKNHLDLKTAKDAGMFHFPLYTFQNNLTIFQVLSLKSVKYFGEHMKDAKMR